MNRFDTVLIVDWSAAQGRQKPGKDSIWIGQTRDGTRQEPLHMPTRKEAEAWLDQTFRDEQAAGRRVLAGFDFPFGYPAGFARAVTGTDDPFSLWDWLDAHITDTPDGKNNRFEVATALNALFPGIGPFWGKPRKDQFPDIPHGGSARNGHGMSERRKCETVAKAASSVWQLCFPPTVGSQALMGIPMLARLRKIAGVAVWPFENAQNAPIVLAEIWPGLIEEAVRKRAAGPHQEAAVRDALQVDLLSKALLRMPPQELAALFDVDAPEEGWILGAEAGDRLTELAMQMDDPRPPPLRNDCFALPAGVEWIPVDEALSFLQNAMRPCTGVETVPVIEAASRILAQEIVALTSNPPHPNTAVDGYGFANGRAEGTHVLPLMTERAHAGAVAGRVPDGHAIRVLTGAKLPEGVDTVVLQEDVTVANGKVAFHGPIKRGANTRRAGEDKEAGSSILTTGVCLAPADLALAAATGHGTLPVRKHLRVGVLSTGDELAEAGAPLALGQIYDANRPMLLSMIARWGMRPVDLGHVPDCRLELKTVLDKAAECCDVVLTSGGASAGDEDHVSALLSETGSLEMWRIAVKPGRPLALGLWQDVPVFGLPGNPVAALVCSLIFAYPALTVLAGGAWRAPQSFLVPAAFSKSKKPGRREFLRARMHAGRAERFHSEGSGRISGLSWADGLIELPDEAVTVTEGDLVRYIPFSSFGL